MILKDYLQPRFIKVGIEAGNKEKAFKELVTFFCKAEKSKSRDVILDAVIAREEMMSTGIFKGIAVPHCKTSAVETMHCVLGISHKGVQYDSLDGQLVYLLFMIISPMDEPEKHLKLLKHLAELIEIPQFQAELLSKNDPESVFNSLCKFEKMLSKAA
jgi:PTS system fructose-specific IIC component/PTS system nitrogen regulatory IIA component